jgi:hypothetical protein
MSRTEHYKIILQKTWETKSHNPLLIFLSIILNILQEDLRDKVLNSYNIPSAFWSRKGTWDMKSPATLCETTTQNSPLKSDSAFDFGTSCYLCFQIHYTIILEIDIYALNFSKL